jgi:hypothetical protein
MCFLLGRVPFELSVVPELVHGEIPWRNRLVEDRE